MFFAHLREAAGKESITMDVTGKTVAELKELLVTQYQLNQLDTVMTAINEEFATNEEIIQQGDTIAFIPPVSGG